jgi:hypothetical protein
VFDADRDHGAAREHYSANLGLSVLYPIVTSENAKTLSNSAKEIELDKPH